MNIGSLILVTGPTGFIGQRLCAALTEAGYRVRAATRNLGSLPSGAIHEQVAVGEIGANTEWNRAMQGVDAIVHLAARVHVMRDRALDPLAAFRDVNTHGTERLARSAVDAGVRRIVYVSTIKVNGEATGAKPFRETDVPAPSDPYGISKWEAEQCLQRLVAGTGLEAVIVRPPLVYGPGAKGNFLSLLRWVERGIPLPLGDCRNRRSLIGLGNFVDVLTRCVAHPSAAGETFVVSDGEDLSTPELVRRMARVLSRPARLWPVPVSWLRFGARLVRREAVYERLCGSLQVDTGKVRRVLGWAPPFSVDEELARTARWFLASNP